jgi:hypothetical protein
MTNSRDVIGKRVLVGLTFVDATGRVDRRTQFWGPIVHVGEGELTIRRVDTGEEITLPAEVDQLNVANPGTYELNDTGELVDDPDFLSSWTVSHPAVN